METTSTTRPFRDRPRPAAGRTGSKAKPTAVGTTKPAAHGFLRHSFALMYLPARDLPDRKTAEQDFFKSCSYLKKHYKLDLTACRSLPYPYNILIAERELKNKLKTKSRQRELLIMQQEDNRICLTVKESLSYPIGLYYIPVMPLHDLWQQADYQHCAELLTAVCAYLYKEAGIAYYRDEGRYLYYNYEVLEDWLADDQGSAYEDDYARQKTAFADARLQGDFLQVKMRTITSLGNMDSLIKSFQAVTKFEKDCLKIAASCLRLWRSYPDTDFFKHATLSGYETGDYDDDHVTMQEYISFIGSTSDIVSDGLLDMVNSDFNERGGYEELVTTTVFNNPQYLYADQLAFGFGVLELIDALCTLLNQGP